MVKEKNRSKFFNLKNLYFNYFLFYLLKFVKDILLKDSNNDMNIFKFIKMF